MKKIFSLLAFIVLLGFASYAQEMIKVVGDTTDLKVTDGNLVLLLRYSGSTENGAGLFRRIDSTYAEGTNAFDYPYSGYQWVRINFLSGSNNFNEIKLSDGVSVGIGSFTTTATADTTVISGATSSDVYFISGQYTAGVDQQDVLQWTAKTDTLIVTRMSSGESDLGYSWLRIKK